MDVKKCVIKCNRQENLAAGYTRVRVLPKNYTRLVTITGITGETLQSVVDKLLTFALDNCVIEDESGKIIKIKI